MPSAPRFNTPDFSVTSSPSATMMSGVPATMVAARIDVRMLSSIFRRLSLRQQRTQPIVDEHVRPEQEEEQHPLEHLRDRRRQAQILLRLFSAEVQERHQEAREKDPD